MATPSAVIFGCAGPALTAEEADFFRTAAPLGFILFARNCETPDQVGALTGSLRESIERSDAPVLIDQEGGRVQRLGPPHWRAAPAAGDVGNLARTDIDKAREAAYLNARLIAAELYPLGIDVDCLPILDVPVPGAHDIIGDRAFAQDPEVVATLGRAACEGLFAGGVLPVIKHIPGHGRASADSHLDLPRVDAAADDLAGRDFVPFRALNDMPWGMTAHVLYSSLDPTTVATLSPIVVHRTIRGSLGFDGLLLTDDISMGALTGTIAERTRKSLDAGCDVVLHCNGEMEEMRAVAEATPEMTGEAMDRYVSGRGRMHPPAPFDIEAGMSRLDELMG